MKPKQNWTHKRLSEVKYTWQPKPPFGHTSEMETRCGNQMLLPYQEKKTGEKWLILDVSD